MEISKSISFITEDPRWQQKLMIGTGVIIGSAVLSVVFIGIIGFIIFAGYCVRLLQNVRDGQPYPLPEWDQWGEDLARGFKLVIASLVWGLPILVLVIPSIIGSAMTESRSDGAQFMGSMLLICGSCLTMIYGLLLTAVTPGISIAFAKDEQITSALQFRQILAWTQANIGQVLVVTLVYIAASIALTLVGSIVGVLLCVVGLIITIPLASLLTSLFQYHLYGQLAYNFPYPAGGGPIDPELTAYTPSTEMAPGVTPLVPPVGDTIIGDTTVGTDTPVGDTTDYPDSGVDNPAPPPAV
jgi:cytochrome b561